MINLLLFDIDATLLHTHGAGIRAMQRAGQNMFGEHFSLEGIVFAGCLDPDIFRDAALQSTIENHEEHLEDFMQAYREELKVELDSTPNPAHILPGVIDLLSTLREREDVMLGLVTGNYAITAPIKLKAVNIEPDWFVANGFGCMADYRPHLVPIAIKTAEEKVGGSIPTDQVIVIGDTPHDIQAGNENGCISFGVGTGIFSKDDLLEAGAHTAVDDLSNPDPLLSLLK